jgi:hypothetical protein
MTAVAFTYVYACAYAWPYCTKISFFSQISMSISNNQLPIIAEKFGILSFVKKKRRVTSY